MAKAWGPR